MAGVIAADGAAADHGHGAVHWEILRAEVCILRYVIHGHLELSGRRLTITGWAKFMEWKYPVEIVITNKTAFKAAGAIEAAATL